MGRNPYEKTLSTIKEVDNEIDAVGTTAEVENPASYLWDTTFVSYPPDMVIKMPYYTVSNLTITPAEAVKLCWQFKPNSLYDPDQTLTGHQPLGRDTWAGIYNYYKVLETRYTVRFYANAIKHKQWHRDGDGEDMDSGSTDVKPLYTACSLNIDGSVPPNLTTWKEAGKVSGNQQAIHSSQKYLWDVVGRGDTAIEHHMTWKPNMFDSALIDSSVNDTWTAVGSNPDGGSLNYFNVICFNPNNADYSYVMCEIDIMYLVAFKQVNKTLTETTN
jgi:hypothetical protein